MATEGGVVGRPKFSRQHYIMIADLIGKNPDASARKAEVEKYAETFAADNPRFDRERFMAAVVQSSRSVETPMGEEMAEGGFVDEEPGFVVIENTPGYLPDSEPADFEDYSDAVAYANDLADELEEQGYETDRSVASRDNYYAISATRPDEPHDLGRVIEVVRAEPLARGGAYLPLQAGATIAPDAEGVAVAENVGPGVPAIIGEAGPEAVIPLDDPGAVEKMAEAIEQAGAATGANANDATIAAAEAVEAAAEAVEVVAAADAAEGIAEAQAEAVEEVAEAQAEAVEEVAEAQAEVAEEAIEAAAEVVEEKIEADEHPQPVHGFFR